LLPRLDSVNPARFVRHPIRSTLRAVPGKRADRRIQLAKVSLIRAALTSALVGGGDNAPEA
jgi:hypothetical protein